MPEYDGTINGAYSFMNLEQPAMALDFEVPMGVAGITDGCFNYLLEPSDIRLNTKSTYLSNVYTIDGQYYNTRVHYVIGDCDNSCSQDYADCDAGCDFLVSDLHGICSDDYYACLGDCNRNGWLPSCYENCQNNINDCSADAEATGVPCYEGCTDSFLSCPNRGWYAVTTKNCDGITSDYPPDCEFHLGYPTPQPPDEGQDPVAISDYNSSGQGIYSSSVTYDDGVPISSESACSGDPTSQCSANAGVATFEFTLYGGCLESTEFTANGVDTVFSLEPSSSTAYEMDFSKSPVEFPYADPDQLALRVYTQAGLKEVLDSDSHASWVLQFYDKWYSKTDAGAPVYAYNISAAFRITNDALNDGVYERGHFLNLPNFRTYIGLYKNPGKLQSYMLTPFNASETIWLGIPSHDYLAPLTNRTAYAWLIASESDLVTILFKPYRSVIRANFTYDEDGLCAFDDFIYEEPAVKFFDTDSLRHAALGYGKYLNLAAPCYDGNTDIAIGTTVMMGPPFLIGNNADDIADVQDILPDAVITTRTSSAPDGENIFLIPITVPITPTSTLAVTDACNPRAHYIVETTSECGDTTTTDHAPCPNASHYQDIYSSTMKPDVENAIVDSIRLADGHIDVNILGAKIPIYTVMPNLERYSITGGARLEEPNLPTKMSLVIDYPPPD